MRLQVLGLAAFVLLLAGCLVGDGDAPLLATSTAATEATATPTPAAPTPIVTSLAEYMTRTWLRLQPIPW